MAKVTFDVTDQDPDESTAAPEPPPPGLYQAKIMECVAGFKKGDDGKPDKSAPRLEVTYQTIAPADDKNPDYKGGGRVWDYVTFYETTKRRLDQFLQAVGAANKSKRKGQLDTEKVVGMTVKLRVTADTNQKDEYRPKVGGVWRWDGGKASTGDDPDFADDAPAKPAKAAAKTTKAAKKAAPAPEPEPEPSLGEIGEAADGGDDDAVQELTRLAVAAGVDPDEYATWSELAEALAGDGGEDGGGETEDPEAVLRELGESGDADDTDAQAKLTELAEANDIDPNAYETWAEVATQLVEAGVDPNEEPGDPF